MATITRDTWGIAHIEAGSADEAFAAQGWVAADDRIWQMEWDRLRAEGRWSEVVGFQGAREDAFFRRLGLAAAARADWDRLNDRTKAMTEAYARGVNTWLAANGDALPEEFAHHPFPPARWEPWHCVAVFKVRHVFMGTLYRKLWRGAVTLAAGPEAARAMRGDPRAASAMVPGEGPPIDLLADASRVVAEAAETMAPLEVPEGGSNSWAVHGSRTASGRPLLAGDPHRGIEFPNVYHQCHVACDSFEAIGLGFPGVPGFAHFGHNDDVAWCITHGMADDTDVFVETDALTDVDWTSETMKIRGEEPVEVYVGRTPRGPVAIGDPASGVALAIQWTGISGVDTTLDCLWPMLEATSCDELEASVRDWVIPVNNLLTADVAGNISFHLRGRVVERTPASRWTPVPGSDEHEWSRFGEVAFDDLPGWRNPERGFLVTANNRISDRGPFVSLDFAGPARHDRIVELLEGLDAATPDDMLTIHRDVTSLVAPQLVGLLRRLGVTGTTAGGHAAWALLDGWDGCADEASVGATIASIVRRRWAESVGARFGIGAPELGAPGWPRALDSSRMLFEAATELLLGGGWQLVPGIDHEADLRSALDAALDETAEELTQRLGPDSAAWTWGTVHRMASPHPLASALPAARHLHPPLDGCPGDSDTVRCGTVMVETGERAAAASVARYVFDVGNWDASGWIVPHGVSGVRDSGHDLDQRAHWLAGEVVPMAYSADAVGAHTASRFEVTF